MRSLRVSIRSHCAALFAEAVFNYGKIASIFGLAITFTR
jgi:hypothetical protein